MLKINLFITLLSSAILFAQNVNIPNTDFKDKLLEADSSKTTAKDLNGNYFKVDANNDGEIQESEAQQVSYLNLFNTNTPVSGNTYTPLDIDDLTEIDSFNDLKTYIVFSNDTLRYVVQNLTDTNAVVNTTAVPDDFFVQNASVRDIPAAHIVKKPSQP